MSIFALFRTPYLFIISLIVFQSAVAEIKNIEPLTANADLWISNLDELEERFPDIYWKNTNKKNVYRYSKNGMNFWGQPLSGLKLEVNAENQLVQALFLEVINKEQSAKLSDADFRNAVNNWRKIISDRLDKKSKEMPSLEIGANNYSRIAWNGNHSTIVLAVISDKKEKWVELICYEREYGISRLLLEGKLEIAQEEVEVDDSPTELSGRKTSLASTRNLQKKYKIEENFDAGWPKLVKTDSPEIIIVKESEEEKKFIYHSPNYEFISDVKISKTIIKNFSTLFESTRLYCQQMPISMVRAHMPENTVKYKILLFGTKASYFRNGGPPGSAGVYMPGSGVIMVPLSGLGVKKVGSSYMFDYKVSNKTLPHEITHQLTNIEYFNPGARGWFSEGLAEYVAATSYRGGKFMVNGNLNDIRSYVTEGSRKDGRGRYLGKEISAPDIKQYMLMSYGQFTANGNFNYGLGALITYYFLHMENDGDRKNINAFLDALNNGKRGEDALKVLLAGRSYDQLEEDISKAWRSRSVKIKFR